APLRVACALPTMQAVVVFQVETQRTLRGYEGAGRDADWHVQIVVRAVSGDAACTIRQVTDAQADIGGPSPFVADEVLANHGAAFHVPVLVATLAARRRITAVQRVAIWRRAVGRDQEGRTPAVVAGTAKKAPRIGPKKPVP